MSEAAADLLVTDPGGLYVDATAGGGGHSAAIVTRLTDQGGLIALDRDAEALKATRHRLCGSKVRVRLMHAAYADLGSCCEAQHIDAVDGVLFDLGVSSHQLDAAERGFSYLAEGPLDMRMDTRQETSAATCLAHVQETELRRIIRDLGEEREARRIARALVARRADQGLKSTRDIREAVLSTRPRMPNKTLSRVFQAIRIVVNDELGQLDRALDASAGLLRSGGRLVVIAYHSLEDRLVKHRLAGWIHGCVCPPRIPVCVCGRKPQFRPVLTRPRRADPVEVKANPRARSAIMRAVEKL